MYGAMRTRAPASTKIAGISAAIVMTAAVGAALANGFAIGVVKMIEPTITFTPMPEEERQPEKPPEQNLFTDDQITLDMPAPLPPDIPFEARKDVIIGEPGEVKRDDPRIVKTGAAVVPAPLRISPKIFPGESPIYPAAELRKGNQGVSTLEVCVSANGRVTSATLANSSGHPGLDNAALKWVRTARFTPGKLDGVPQATCGHDVVYEWNLKSARG